MTISAVDLRPGMTVEIDRELYQVQEYKHIKVAQGKPTIRVKVKRLKTGAVLEKSFRGGEKLDRAHIERKEMQLLYRTKDAFTFMDQQTFEQISLDLDQLKEAVNYIKEGAVVSIAFYEGMALGVDLPSSVELKITETEPGIRGNTVSGGSKPATLETGLVVKVPLFINIGDIIKVDTRSKGYISRV